MTEHAETVWERVDERVLLWVATLPPAFTNQEPYHFPPQPHAFAPIEGLNTREVGESIRRLVAAGFVSGVEQDRHGEDWSELRLGPRGLVYLGEWPDVELVASALTFHRLLRAVAEAAPEAERDALTRAAGVLGRTADGVIRETLGEIAHEGGAEAAT